MQVTNLTPVIGAEIEGIHRTSAQTHRVKFSSPDPNSLTSRSTLRNGRESIPRQPIPRRAAHSARPTLAPRERR